MHIEPGILAASKLVYANGAALATLAGHAGGYLKRPGDLVRTVLAAVFFSVFMEMFHMPVGPSELHFVGASAVYFLFGFLPTLFGFAIGLALQGLLFEPQDLVHLGVNSLSLMLPLVATHLAVGRHFYRGDDATRVAWKSVVKFDAAYYVGVTGMVGFWLAIGEEATPFPDWAVFALSYLPLVFIEPLFTTAVLKLLANVRDHRLVRAITTVAELRFA